MLPTSDAGWQRTIFWVAKIKGKVKILLDIDQVLNARELKGLDALLQP